MLAVQTIPARQLVPDLRTAWEQIIQDVPTLRHPLLAPQFCQTVAQARDDVEVIVFNSGDQPIGFLPFHRMRNGVAAPLADMISDYHGAVMAPDVEWSPPSVMRALGLHTFRFHHLPTDQSAFAPHTFKIDPAYYIDISQGFSAYVDARRASGSSVVSQINRKRRKLVREVGELHFQLHDPSPEVLAKLIEWKSAKLERQGFPNSFRQPWVAEFARLLTNLHSPNCAGLLSTLRAGDQLIAAHLGSRSQSIVSSWLPGHAPPFEHYSPGLILTVELAQAAAAAGIQSIDLGRGENPLKTRLSTHQVPLAIGSVETRPLNRMVSRSVQQTKAFSHRFPAVRTAIQAMRKAI